MSDKTESVYLVFSSTPYKIGAAIRFVTRNQFNHVSLCLDPSPVKLYTFARYFENTPLFGGFVEESPLRYQMYGRTALLKVCRVAVTPEQKEYIRARLEEIYRSREEYIYNLLSAAAAAFGGRVLVPDAYTCVEFVSGLLAEAGIPGAEACGSIRKLEQALGDNVVFLGNSDSFFPEPVWGDDMFLEKKSSSFYLINASRNFGKLISRKYSGAV